MHGGDGASSFVNRLGSESSPVKERMGSGGAPLSKRPLRIG
ncbi:hypothetical protein [Priestia endophytica]|nr:hypothetical protein [Priestia endophytica]